MKITRCDFCVDGDCEFCHINLNELTGLQKEIVNTIYNQALDDFANWLCEKYEVFEPEDDGYTLYGDMKYHSKEELLNEFLAR